MDSNDSGQDPLAGSFQHRNSSPGSINDVNLQTGYKMLKNCQAQWR